MTGRRLLDAAAIFKASKDVAAKHVALRQHQLDLYSKTSSLSKAIKSQTDRVTLTVKAASNLAKRFNGPGPEYATQAPQPRKSPHDVSISTQDAPLRTERSENKNSLSQDHFHERPVQSTPRENLPDSSLGVKQEQAKQYPLPDGTISTVDSQEEPEVSHGPILDSQRNQGVIYSSSSKNEEEAVPRAQAVPEQENPSDDVYTKLFHSPRVARMLRGQSNSSEASKGLEMAGIQETPVKQTKAPKETDHVSSSFRTIEQESQDKARGSVSRIGHQADASEDVQKLAGDMAEDAVAASADSADLSVVSIMAVTPISLN